MKLKLVQQDHGAVLSVTESLAPEQVAIIKAGLQKIFKTSIQPLLIDLTELSGEALDSERIAVDFLTIKVWALCHGYEVFVVCATDPLGDIPTLAQGIELIASPELRRAKLEAVCAPFIERLEQQKQSALKKLETLAGSASSLRGLRKSNSDLRQRVALAETQLRALQAQKIATSSHHASAATLSENLARLQTAQRTLAAVLVRQGILDSGEAASTP